ncbi:MAG: trigger factor [Clostridia bacterium]|nr:trigger factor [Clostridia bacterium]
MSLIKKELTENSGFVIEFSVSKEVYAKAEQEAYKKNVKSITIPGFRKGKAPKAIIEKYYGKGIWFEDAINACIPEAFEEAIKEAELDIVGQPQFDLVSDEDDIILKATGYVKPEVSIEGYKGIDVERNVAEVTEADVDAEVERARKRNARTVEVTDRAAQMGDIANIDFEGFVDGVAFAGGKGEGHDLTLGSGQFIPGFEDQIVGKSIGEEFDVNVTFPEDYNATELAGKAATFKTKLNALKAEELPALDDEFAKDVSEFDTLDEYKADIKAKMVQRNENNADAEVENALADALAEKLVGEIPPVMIDAEVENTLRQQDERLRQSGLDLNTYLQYIGSSLEAIREQLRPGAEKQVKVRLALEKIASLEAITVSEEETEAEYQKISDTYSVPVDRVKSMIDAADLNADILVSKALKLVRDNANLSSPKPAKKTAKKAAKAEDGEEAPKAKKTTKKAAKAEDGEEAPKAKKTTKKTAKSDDKAE